MLLPFVAFASCAVAPTNVALERFDPDVGYRVKNVVSDDAKETFVILTFSGGGTRAAALSYGALEKLRDTEIAGGRSLLSEVDLISSVSGGSFTAAYYALHGSRIFETFEQAFLNKDVQGILFWQLWNPVNWFRLASGTFNRIDLAAEYYDEEVFGGATFADLLRQTGRPFALINATDMTLGSRFEFTQDQFDLLSSDLSKYRIARAVAASSAFPVLLSPVRMVNHPTVSGFIAPAWIGNGLENRLVSPMEHQRASNARSYLDKAADGIQKRRPNVHLMDGGISDNIGLRGPLVAASTSRGGAWSLLRDIDNGKVKRVVVIVVDAKTDPSTDWDQSASSPGFSDTLMVAATRPMDNFSSVTIEAMQELFKRMQRAADERTAIEKIVRDKYDPAFALPPMATVALNFVHVSFDDIADEAERRRFKDMPTSFSLKPQEVRDLRGMAARLLDQHPAFRELVAALQAR